MNKEMNSQVGITLETYDVPEQVFKTRMVKALEGGIARYAIYRRLQFAARIELEALLDAIAMDPAWHVERLSSTSLVGDGDGLFISGGGTRKSDYCSRAMKLYIPGADAVTPRNGDRFTIGGERQIGPLPARG